MENSTNQLLNHLNSLVKTGGNRESVLAEALAAVLNHFHSETGTLHRLDEEKQLLFLIAQKGLPPQVINLVNAIPVGKGIAGQVVAQNQPVTICNLQMDTSGVSKPAARQTGVGGAVCVPVRQDGKLIGTLGVGTVREYEYTTAETTLLEEVGRLIAPFCAPE